MSHSATPRAAGRAYALQLGVWSVLGIATLIRAGQWSRESAPPPLRETPLTVLPEHNLDVVVTDEQLRRVLIKLAPRFYGARTKINHVDHGLRFWTVDAKFRNAPPPSGTLPPVEDPAAEQTPVFFASGAAMRRLLLDHRRFAEVYGEEAPPLLLDKSTGVAVRTQEGEESSSHVDHTVACLAEVGTPLEFPMVTKERGETTFRLAVEEVLHDFRLNQIEYEWSALTFALFLPPVREWRTTEGQLVSFDTLAERIMREWMPDGVCFGNHRLHALVMFLRIDEQEPILEDSTREAIRVYLREMTGTLVRNQHPDGFWNYRWPEAQADSARPTNVEGDRIQERILATGHALEWWALAPDDLLPPRPVLAAAGQWLVREIDNLTEAEVEQHYTYLTHAGRALALWRGTNPAAFLLSE